MAYLGNGKSIDENWRDECQKRLFVMMNRLANPGIMAGDLRLDLQSLTPMAGRGTMFRLTAFGLRQPLSFSFSIASSAREPYCITPLDPDFEMYSNPLPEGYPLFASSGDRTIRAFAADVLANYKSRVMDPDFSPLDPRVMRARNMKLVPC